MKKAFPAFLAALVITAILGLGMFVIGQDALGVSAAQAAAGTDTTQTSDNLAQFEQILVQYQTREVQYQDELNNAIARIDSANQQLSQANQQIQEYQNLLAQLQSTGLITIAGDSTITINQPAFVQRGDHPERDH